jgi:LPS-assembly protein
MSMADGRRRLKTIVLALRLALPAPALACLALLALPWLAAGVAAQPAALDRAPIVLTADEIVYAADANRVTARGNVEMIQDGRTLLTDQIAYDVDAGTVTASGNIVLIEATGDAVFAEELALDDRLANGFVQGIGVLLDDDSRLAAVRGVRTDGERTTLDRAVYSPCEICEDGGEPLWQIKAERVVHDQATGTVAYRNARLELLGVPILYTPYLYHPDPSVERRSGFLTPSFGSDTELGFTLETPFFVNLAPNRDLVLSPLFTTSAGVYLGAEYRELQRFGLTEIGGGVTYTDAAGKVNEQDNVQQSGSEVRGHVDSRGRYVLGERNRAGFDLRLASDDSVLQRYGISNADVLENRAFAEHYGDRDFLSVNLYGFQSLREEDDQDEIPFVLPLAEATIFGPRDRFGGQTDWRTSVLGLTRSDGLDTRRFSTQLGWQLPHIGPMGDVWSLRLALRGDIYNTAGDPVTRGPDGDDDTTGRLVPTANLNWGLPLVGETGSWSHVIEPRVALSYTPSGVNKNDIPNEDSLVFEFDETNLFEANRFTGIDLVETGTRLAYGLNFDSLGPAPWRVAGLIGQSVRTEEENEFPEGSGLEDRVSDIVGRIDLRPAELLDVGYRFRLDKTSLAFRRSDLSLAFGPPRLRFEIQYLRLSDELPDQDLRRRQELVAGVRLQMLDSLAVGIRTRRDLEEDRTVTTQYGLVYTNTCLVLVAGLEQSFTRRGELDDEVSFKVSVTFRGLGDLAASTDVF